MRRRSRSLQLFADAGLYGRAQVVLEAAIFDDAAPRDPGALRKRLPDIDERARGAPRQSGPRPRPGSAGDRRLHLRRDVLRAQS